MKRRKYKPRICVSVGKKNTDDVQTLIKRIESDADVIEIRLDCLDTIELSPLTQTTDTPLLFTNRPVWEGGNFSGDEDVRITSLLEALRLNCEYIDLELRAPAKSHLQVMSAAENSSSQIILSWHNFDMTPSHQELLTIMEKMVDQSAHIGKIVTMAHDYHDVLRVLQLQEAAAKIDFPLIAFCMGSAGVISRLATLELGGYMTYCAVDKDEATAPGQLSLDTLREIYRQMV